MTEQELQEIKARCKKATPGPWEVEWNISYDENGDPVYAYGCGPTKRGGIYEEMRDTALIDADFIAHARQDVPALVAEVERLTAWNDIGTIKPPEQVYVLISNGIDIDVAEDIGCGAWKGTMYMNFEDYHWWKLLPPLPGEGDK